MMNLAVVASLLIVLAISLQPVKASRRCWCDARINGRVVKTFGDGGVIARCGGWCGCRNSNMLRCDLTCDEIVAAWARNNCLKTYENQMVKSHYKASNCHSGDGRTPHKCSPPCYKQITKRVPYTCYKTVTQNVVTSCGSNSNGRKISSSSAVSSKGISDARGKME